MALNLKHQTAAQFAAWFWEKLKAAYQAGDKLTYHRMIWWIWSRIQAGDLTSDQVRQSFNAAYGRSLNTSQWNSFVTSTLIPIKDRYIAMRDQADL
jgi:hypothetical protein